MEKQIFATIDEYIAACPAKAQPFLNELRQAIVKAAPEATEKISWGMATFVYYGNLVHFSAEKNHIGFHPAPSAIEAFRRELSNYTCSKGTVRLPYDRSLPLELIDRMVRFRVEEQANLVQGKLEGQKRSQSPRPRYEMPKDVLDALVENALFDAYKSRPPYQRNDYIGWITRAKKPETQKKRLDQMLDELYAGNLYMGTAYAAKPFDKENTNQ